MVWVKKVIHTIFLLFRSVGGEIEDQVSVQVQRGYQQISPPSLHETHFESDLDDIDLPSCRTVLHHPDPFVSTTNHRRAGQRPSYAGNYTNKTKVNPQSFVSWNHFAIQLFWSNFNFCANSARSKT